jgi:outer membrane receptor protein involved in Fe transport
MLPMLPPRRSWLSHRAARRLVVAALALLVIGSGRAAAVDAAPDERADVLADVLAQPVYGGSRLAAASKYEQDADEAPSMVYVRTGGEIRAQGYRTLAEVLESLPGIPCARTARTPTSACAASNGPATTRRACCC